MIYGDGRMDGGGKGRRWTRKPYMYGTMDDRGWVTPTPFYAYAMSSIIIVIFDGMETEICSAIEGLPGRVLTSLPSGIP